MDYYELAANLLTATEAAAVLGVSQRRVQQLCQSGRLGHRIHGRFVISRDELNTFKPGRAGRPKKRTPAGSKPPEPQPLTRRERIALRLKQLGEQNNGRENYRRLLAANRAGN